MSKNKKNKPMQSARSKERALAFQILYSLEFTNIQTLEDLEKSYLNAPRVLVRYDNPEASVHHLERNEEDENEAIPYAPPSPQDLQDEDTIEDISLQKELNTEGFAWELVAGVWQNLQKLDNTIEENAKNWRIDRLGRIEVTILRIGLFEILFRDDIPLKVSIAEALELTSQFADAKAHSFINGLLDAVHKNTNK